VIWGKLLAITPISWYDIFIVPYLWTKIFKFIKVDLNSVITIYQLKPAFQKILSPLVKQLAKQGITANQITTSAAVLSVLMGIAIVLWHCQRWLLLLMPLVLFMRIALNAIDGMLARDYNQKTSLGTILNELGDVISDTALYLPFALIPGVSSILVVPIVLLSIISEMTGVLGVTVSGKRQYQGPMVKSDRAFLFGIIALLLGLGLTAGKWLDYIWITTILLLFSTIINRAYSSLKELEYHGLDEASN
jgi:CDP-diacylglycerol--glycerol-3-phosphate 3-phosphatidyltransferase